MSANVPPPSTTGPSNNNKSSRRANRPSDKAERQSDKKAKAPRPLIPVCPEDIKRCQAFIAVIERIIQEIPHNPMLVPDPDLSVSCGPFEVSTKFFTKLEGHWHNLPISTVFGTTADSDTPSTNQIPIIPSSNSPVSPALSADEDHGDPSSNLDIMAKMSLLDKSTQIMSHHLLHFTPDSHEDPTLGEDLAASEDLPASEDPPAPNENPAATEEYLLQFFDIPPTLNDIIKKAGGLSSLSVIPIGLLPKPQPIDKDDETDPFYERITRSLIFSIQHPKGIAGPDGKFDAEVSVRRFADAIAASRIDRGGVSQDPLYTALCVVWTDQMDHIPVFFGHSAWRSLTERIPSASDKAGQTAYRQVVIRGREFTELERVSRNSHPVEQCAEHLALPFAFRAAQRYLAEGKGDKVTISSMTMKYEKERNNSLSPEQFCKNCAFRALELVMTVGVRIVDEVIQTTYESPETAKLFEMNNV